MKLKQAIDLDRKDNLKKYKSHFINSKKEIYLNGNSLGKLPEDNISNLNDKYFFYEELLKTEEINKKPIIVLIWNVVF